MVLPVPKGITVPKNKPPSNQKVEEHQRSKTFWAGRHFFWVVQDKYYTSFHK